MLATISKEFSFHAAHQLPNHDGQCRRLHGHSYRLEVIVTGQVQPMHGNSDEGMVLDFAVLKDIYKEHVEPRVEHQNLNETLRHDVEVTTSEQIAKWILWTFQDALTATCGQIGPTRRITGVCIRLWETPTSYAEVGDQPWRG